MKKSDKALAAGLERELRPLNPGLRLSGTVVRWLMARERRIAQRAWREGYRAGRLDHRDDDELRRRMDSLGGERW